MFMILHAFYCVFEDIMCRRLFSFPLVNMLKLLFQLFAVVNLS